MPKRKDLHKILIIGSGPIVIGQACEFDYSGTQACKALREEGYEVILVNSNPATIMTDPELADKTYIEPITPEMVEKIIAKERPDAVLPTLGGQTGLNVTMQLAEAGVLEKYNVQMIGADSTAIKKAEDRELFKEAMNRIGLELPRGDFAYNLDEAKRIAADIGFPIIVRPSYTLGGRGGGIAYNQEEFEKIAALGIESSRINEISVEESILGWKEYELEVMRDHKDNVVIICAIENFDPVGVHTGDSITVAPAQTLTDKEYQMMRDASIDIMREIGVETGGSNVQFAIDPKNGRMIVIEMNPRVSRSSALASKATGFPIAKFAAKLAVGYTLDEISNDITRETPACFEPAIDYCVVKIPRFTFEKFPEAIDILGISMKSVGETMAIGRTFKEALQKGLRGMEIGHIGLDNKFDYKELSGLKIVDKLERPNATRIFYIKYALQSGMSVQEICSLSGIDPWFVDNIEQIYKLEEQIKSELAQSGELSAELLRKAKEYGFGDAQLAQLLSVEETEFRSRRKEQGVTPVYKLVDTCAAEFEAYTPYYYSTYEQEQEARVSDKKKIMILGGGPNRIGQGIEFDYCCCHAAFALKDLGYETIMVNSNPETVSTDYDTSDKLYFEPLTFEDVMNIVDTEKPDGVIVQFGGQTPLNLARALHEAGVPIIGTSVDSIDRAESREQFAEMIQKLGLKQPENGIAYSEEEAVKEASRIGYPVLVRPSYVLGGRAMRIIYTEDALRSFFAEAKDASKEGSVLIDQFLEGAIEVDADGLCDGKDVFVAGIMEHIEGAGIHSGDSACVLPPHTLSKEQIAEIKQQTTKIAQELQVVGLLNIQFAVKGNDVYLIEVNPRASRTVPFVSKVTGNSLAKLASQLMIGAKLSEFDLIPMESIKHVGVKESVLPFNRFSGVDIVLGPEMKSTGEVMGIAQEFGESFAKSQISAGQNLPKQGLVFLSVNDCDKQAIVDVARRLDAMGLPLIATPGTARVIKEHDIKVKDVSKIDEGEMDVLTLMEQGQIKLVINTPSGQKSQIDMKAIRKASVMHSVPSITTIQGAYAAVSGIETMVKSELTVQTIQDYYEPVSVASS